MRLFQALSLDVTGGALAMGLFAVSVLQVKPNRWWWPVLALSVWAVYTADHLLDGYVLKNASVIFRHRFHYHYRYFFWMALGLASLTAVVLVWCFLGLKILFYGLLLGAAALTYLTLILLTQKSGWYFHKEFFISLFYVAGIWLAPLVWYGKAPDFGLLLHIVVVVFLAWAEGLMMTVFEYEDDQQAHMQSFATFYGVSVTCQVVSGLLALGFAGITFLFIRQPVYRTEILILVFLDIILVLLLIFNPFFRKNHRYRFWGEFAFWLPFVLLFFPH